jgi:hypothetical protein
VRRIAAALALGLLALPLTACDPAESGSAAVVGESRITERYVNDTATESLAALGDAADQIDGAAMNRRIVQTAVADRLVKALAEQEGVTVSQSEVDELLESTGGDEGREQLELQLAETGVPPSQVDAFAEFVALQDAVLASFSSDESEAQALASDALSELAREIGVSVSPRYGEWDPDSLEIVDLTTALTTPAS